MGRSRCFVFLVILAAICFSSCLEHAAAQPTASGPSALLVTWAEAYGSMDAQRIAALYTEEARYWGITSREQSVGREAIQASFGRPREGITAVRVTFGEHGVTRLGENAAVASGRWELPDALK